METLKPSFKTGEFYLTLGTMISGILVMTGMLVPERAGEVSELIAQSIGAIVVLGALIAQILSRTELKKKSMEISGSQQG